MNRTPLRESWNSPLHHSEQDRSHERGKGKGYTLTTLSLLQAKAASLGKVSTEPSVPPVRQERQGGNVLPQLCGSLYSGLIKGGLQEHL